MTTPEAFPDTMLNVTPEMQAAQKERLDAALDDIATRIGTLLSVKEVTTALGQHGMFIDYEAQVVTCGCGGFAGTMPFMQHVIDVIESLR